MAKAKPYKSREYLWLQYITKGLSIDKIAERCNVSHNTIRQALKDFGILK